MNKEVKMYVCGMNLRPVKGEAFIPAGTPFDPSILDDHTREVFESRGQLKEYVPDYIDTEGTIVEEKREQEQEQIDALKAEALEKYGVKINARKLKTVQKAFDKAKAEADNKPSGIFTKTVEELEGMNLDEMDAIHADICAENELPAPAAFKSEEEAVAKLTGEV